MAGNLFLHKWLFVRGMHRLPVSPLTKIQLCGALMFTLMSVWSSCWTDRGIVGDLTHWSWLTHICVGNLTIIGLDDGLSPGHYLIQCWSIVNWNITNKFQWNLKRNLYIFIPKNALENVVCEMASICLGLNVLTLNVREPSYLGLTRSISWLLMPWLLTSPGHQQPW